MFGKTAFRLAVVMFVLVGATIAQGQDKIQNYFNDIAAKVKATTDPAQKREVLTKSFESMVNSLNKVQGSPLVTENDKVGIEKLKVIIGEKQDELAGRNGFQRVPDAELNAFAVYVVQDMEQAEQTVTISLVALLLIILIAVLVL
ncbi:MAG: hypothetical protein WBP29_11930 [Candidatus Zixiibacteriota bacterium]